MKLFAKIISLIIFIQYCLIADNINIIVLDDSLAPYSWYDNNKTIQGVYPILADKIFSEAKLKFQIKLYPWKRAISMLENNEAILAGIYKTTDREKIYYFSKPLYQEKLVVYSLKSKNLFFSSINDFKDKKIGINMGWVISNEFEAYRSKNLFKVQTAKQSEDNFKKLEHGRIDFFIADELNGDYALKSLNLEDKFKKHEVPLVTNDSFIAISKNYPGAMQIIEAIDISISKLNDDKIVDKIINDFLTKFKSN